jgi:hypothetical protein
MYECQNLAVVVAKEVRKNHKIKFDFQRYVQIYQWNQIYCIILHSGPELGRNRYQNAEAEIRHPEGKKRNFLKSKSESGNLLMHNLNLKHKFELYPIPYFFNAYI